MTALEAKDRLGQFQRVGEDNKLTVFGFLQGHYQHMIWDFAAGRLQIEPEIHEAEEPAEPPDYRIVYTSRDGERRRDITDLTDDEFVAFMQSEPPGLIER